MPTFPRDVILLPNSPKSKDVSFSTSSRMAIPHFMYVTAMGNSATHDNQPQILELLELLSSTSPKVG
jgi:hypothetical protein